MSVIDRIILKLTLCLGLDLFTFVVELPMLHPHRLVSRYQNSQSSRKDNKSTVPIGHRNQLLNHCSAHGF